MDANFERYTYEKVSAGSKWSDYDFGIFFTTQEVDAIMDLEYITV